ncbi:class I SAM-dependent methyltransferase [Kiritimatiellota bacterium B12222]|nr:class I SAM-dependent methyltransferase [Kiritimatiellota bacterium B12222]
MSQSNCRGRKLLKQLPARIRIHSPDPLSRLDEAIAALKVVDSTCTPPTYMIGDLQWIGAAMGFRPNSRGYLRHMATKAVNSGGDILECGSGLSTLLLAVTAGRLGHQVHTFEHDRHCYQRLLTLIDRYQLSNVSVHHAPIRSYGSFDWYDIPTSCGSDCFQLVICDGPARHLTDSGRYGLFPVMRQQLDPKCRVIMDDSNRSLERHVIKRWRKEQRIEVHSFGRFLQFAEIICV